MVHYICRLCVYYFNQNIQRVRAHICGAKKHISTHSAGIVGPPSYPIFHLNIYITYILYVSRYILRPRVRFHSTTPSAKPLSVYNVFRLAYGCSAKTQIFRIYIEKFSFFTPSKWGEFNILKDDTWKPNQIPVGESYQINFTFGNTLYRCLAYLKKKEISKLLKMLDYIDKKNHTHKLGTI